MAEYREEPFPAGPGGGPAGPGRPEPPPARPSWETDRRVAADVAAWRAAAAATADPRWARPGSPAAEGVDPDLAFWPQDWPSDAMGPRDEAVEGVGAPRPSGWAVALPIVLAIAGAALTMASSTMTWATVRAFGLVEFSVSGLDPTQHGRLTFGLGIVVAIAALGLSARPRGHPARLLAGVTGVAGLATALVALVDIGYLRGGGLFAGSGIEATTMIAPGLWLVLGGGLLSLLAALLARPGRYRALGASSRIPADQPFGAEAGQPGSAEAWVGHEPAFVADHPPVVSLPAGDHAGAAPAVPRPGDAKAGPMGS